MESKPASPTIPGRELIVVTGGARAGKSDFAQRLADHLSPAASDGRTGAVLFMATAEAIDPEMADRIQRHRSSRPADWRTLEEPLHVTEAISQASVSEDAVILIDCLNLWVSNLLIRGQDTAHGVVEEGIYEATRRLLDNYEGGRATYILVSNEVGLGLVPGNPLGRRFRDALGKVNQMVAARADRVYLLVSGLPLELKSLGGHNLLL